MIYCFYEQAGFFFQGEALNAFHSFMSALNILWTTCLSVACLVVWARWTVDIDLESSVEEHLTSDAAFPSSILGPAIYFHSYFSVFVHSSHPQLHLF